jgi:hypothetical protein
LKLDPKAAPKNMFISEPRLTSRPPEKLSTRLAAFSLCATSTSCRKDKDSDEDLKDTVIFVDRFTESTLIVNTFSAITVSTMNKDQDPQHLI